MVERELGIKLSDIKIDKDNLDYCVATGEIVGQLRTDIIKTVSDLLENSNAFDIVIDGSELSDEEINASAIDYAFSYNPSNDDSDEIDWANAFRAGVEYYRAQK